jgi:hypothetical protein
MRHVAYPGATIESTLHDADTLNAALAFLEKFKDDEKDMMDGIGLVQILSRKAQTLELWNDAEIARLGALTMHWLQTLPLPRLGCVLDLIAPFSCNTQFSQIFHGREGTEALEHILRCIPRVDLNPHLELKLATFLADLFKDGISIFDYSKATYNLLTLEKEISGTPWHHPKG